MQLRGLIESGNALADLRLRRDDVIYVPSLSERFVSVLGEVQHPGAIPITSSSTLASVLADAGGSRTRPAPTRTFKLRIRPPETRAFSRSKMF